MSDQKIKHLILDYGDVVAYAVLDTMPYISQKYAIDKQAIDAIYEKHVSPFRKGKVNERQFWEGFFAEFGLPLPEDYQKLWTLNWEEKFKIYENVIALVKEVKAQGIVCSVLSNTIDPHRDFARVRGGYDVFEHLFFSNELGMQKPDAEIYEYTLQKLGAKPEETLFVDDTEINLVTARSLGMNTILAVSPEQVVRDVRVLLN